MKTEVQKILNLKQFFKIVQSNDAYKLEKAGNILSQNIHSNWLQAIYSKTQKNLPVYVKTNTELIKKDKLPFAFINQELKTRENITFEQSISEYAPKEKSRIVFNLIVPEQDTMQYFIQWQRYRKYWWSSVTTTPSLFAIDDIKHGENEAHVNIVAKFPSGNQTVETLTINSDNKILKNTSHLSCTISLENAIFILLLDGLTSSTAEGYLRLHRKMAPYKFSFAIEKGSKRQDTLKELSTLLHGRLSNRRISSLMPDLSADIENQIKSSLEIGVAYTAVLGDKTLTDGIFHLLNSSTMLKEQIHIADFDSYASLICGKSIVL